jgi:hypothetical protein
MVLRGDIKAAFFQFADKSGIVVVVYRFQNILAAITIEDNDIDIRARIAL